MCGCVCGNVCICRWRVCVGVGGWMMRWCVGRWRVCLWCVGGWCYC